VLKGESWKFNLIKDLEAFQQWAKEAVTFQPTLHQMISELATKSETTEQTGNSFALYRLAKIYLYEAGYYNRRRAVEYLERSAKCGNIYAYNTLQRMSGHSSFTVAAGVSGIVAGLAGMFERRKVEDCTTLPKPDEEKKRRRYEQSM